jgi:hypothetical protein
MIENNSTGEQIDLPSFVGMRFSTEEWNALNQLQIEQFRANHGTLG